MAGSRDAPWPYLIDGCLAEGGLLDLARFDHALDSERLKASQAQHAVHVLDAVAVAVGAWVRRAPDSRSAGCG